MSTDTENRLRDLLATTLGQVGAFPPQADAAVRLGRRAVRRRRATAGAALGAIVVVLLGAGVGMRASWPTTTSRSQSLAAGPTDAQDRARDYAEQFARGDFESIRRDMPAGSSTLQPRKDYPAYLLAAAWSDATRAFGPLVSTGPATVQTVDPGRVVTRLPLRLAQGSATLQIDTEPAGVVGVDVLTPYTPTTYEDVRLTRSRMILGELADDKTDAARATFSPALQQALPAAQLRQQWQDVLDRYGPYRGPGPGELGPDLLTLRAHLERADVALHLQFNSTLQVTSLSLLPVT